MKKNFFEYLLILQFTFFNQVYAINPFTIEKRKDKIIITQWMQFAKTNKVITWFGPIPIPDNIVHTFDCKPYMYITHQVTQKDIDILKRQGISEFPPSVEII